MDTCIFSSLCSALHYLQFEDITLQVDDLKFKILKEEKNKLYQNAMGLVTQFVNSESSAYFRKDTIIQKIENSDTFDLLDHAIRKPNILYHVVICGDDGAENHAICVVNNYIFDGNYSNALRLSKKSLDAACQSNFIGIASGYKYLLPRIHYHK